MRVGQETFAISASTAIRKSANRGKLTNRYAHQPPTAKTASGKLYLRLDFVTV